MTLSPSELQELHDKLDQVLERRAVRLSDVRVPLVAVVAFLISLLTPIGFVISNHYAVRAHLTNTRIHAEETKAEKLGGVAYSADVAQKERQAYFMLRAVHCGTPNAVQALCSSAYPDGPYPIISALPR